MNYEVEEGQRFACRRCGGPYIWKPKIRRYNEVWCPRCGSFLFYKFGEKLFHHDECIELGLFKEEKEENEE